MWYINSKIKLCLILISWSVCSAQQCTGTITDACGSYVTQPNVIKITPVIQLSGMPSSIPYPVLQNNGYLTNAINIQGSLNSSSPKATIFGIKSETYALCNGIPRFANACCITRSNNGCYFSGQENIYQLSAVYQGAFKSKITIRAIVDNHEQNGFLTGSFLYEGIFDIDPSIGTLPLEAICNLKYIKRLPFNPGPDPVEFCNFNQ